MKTFLTLAFFCPSILLLACGKDDDTGSAADEIASTTGESDDETDGTDEADEGTGAAHEITSTDGDMAFTPTDLTIAVGDTVRFVMSPTHNAIEVSQDTYDARGVAPLDGGFQVTFSETKEVTFTEAGTHYYVCTPHVLVDMVGTITVE